jgi:hypothetical protein
MHPLRQQHREARLCSIKERGRYISLKQFAKRPFLSTPFLINCSEDKKRLLRDSMIEQGYPGFETRALGTTVDLYQQIIRQALRNIPSAHFFDLIVHRLPRDVALILTANTRHHIACRLPLRLHLRQKTSTNKAKTAMSSRLNERAQDTASSHQLNTRKKLQ